MSSIPFTVYDILAYLSSGSLIVVTMDYLFGQKTILMDDIPPIKLVVFLFLAYIFGHIVASFSSLILEELLVGKVLGKPSLILMGKSQAGFFSRIFPGYHRTLPTYTRNRILEQAESRKFAGMGEALFLHSFSLVSRNDTDRKRLDEFRNLYGFCRNTSLALLLCSILLAIGTVTKQEPKSYTWAILSLILGVAMLYRYLKFFRQYTYQLFITYAELPNPDMKKKTDEV